jgi:hypothetical protein
MKAITEKTDRTTMRQRQAHGNCHKKHDDDLQYQEHGM